MELAEVVRRRRMVRRYDPSRAVPDEAVDALVEAALRAPSAGHTQGTSVLVLQDPADRDTFWAAASETPDSPPSRWLAGMQTAPVLLVFWTSRQAYLDRYAEPDKGWTPGPSIEEDEARWTAPYWFVDAGMAAMSSLLTAVDAGLGACFFGIPPARIATVREVFGVPDVHLAVGVISLGYPAEGERPSGSPTRRPRQSPETRVHVARW